MQIYKRVVTNGLQINILVDLGFFTHISRRIIVDFLDTYFTGFQG
jgi:hypothetical protein